MVIVALEFDPELCDERLQLSLISVELIWVGMIRRWSGGGMARGSRIRLHETELLSELGDSFPVEGLSSDGLIRGIVRISG